MRYLEPTTQIRFRTGKAGIRKLPHNMPPKIVKHVAGRTPFWGPKSGPQNGGRLAFLIAINQGAQFWEVLGFQPCPYLIGSVLLEQDIS